MCRNVGTIPKCKWRFDKCATYSANEFWFVTSFRRQWILFPVAVLSSGHPFIHRLLAWATRPLPLLNLEYLVSDFTSNGRHTQTRFGFFFRFSAVNSNSRLCRNKKKDTANTEEQKTKLCGIDDVIVAFFPLLLFCFVRIQCRPRMTSTLNYVILLTHLFANCERDEQRTADAITYISMRC